MMIIAKILGFITALMMALMFSWLFLLITFFLTCKSFERFDNAKTRMTFPYNCEASFDGGEYKNMNW